MEVNINLRQIKMIVNGFVEAVIMIIIMLIVLWYLIERMDKPKAKNYSD